MDRLVDSIHHSGIKLPVDYQMWGHSFFELMPEFLVSIREHFPDDYRKILDWFPLAEAEMFRYDRMRV
jgi:hypothetical protein